MTCQVFCELTLAVAVKVLWLSVVVKSTSLTGSRKGDTPSKNDVHYEVTDET